MTQVNHHHDHPAPAQGHHGPSSLWALTIGAIGVVYGDIGTSPLYAFREALAQTARAGSTGGNPWRSGSGAMGADYRGDDEICAVPQPDGQ
jgi:hypothetical protein